ncbi:hypothetical protein BC937DRAFT_94921 [Endogone sp. FLAS-F59071]|nr:hypothetical protein BC937DRAFT_94921 [Endogone sp. FLAS-F59071]|eukprot:RUS22924.1 hypothetical protein BC937DRAFT_94921 [Endogone sp. FLAS-F59071]
MSLAQWRQFAFFDRISPETGDTAHVLQNINATAFTSGRGRLVVADAQGSVHIMDRSFSVQSFIAYDGGRITHLKQLKQKNILITVGEDDPHAGTPVIKIWDLDRTESKTRGSLPTPACVRIKVQHGGRPFPVTTFAVLENLSQIAIGLANGVVILIRGDISRDRTTKQKIIHEGEEPVTGLGFRENMKSVILFIVTTNKIMSYNTMSPKPNVTILDEQGCGLGCAVMSDATSEMIVGRDEAIYFYDPTGRGQCFAYESLKSSLTWFKNNYLIIVSPPFSTAPTTQLSAGTRAGLPFNPPTGHNVVTNDFTKMTIFDTSNKFVAYVGNFMGGVRGVVCEWGCVWVIGLDGKLYRLEEKDTPTKLDILFKKNLYLLAINLAHSQKYDDASIAEIFKKYGDHLYSKAEYDGAMAQYIRTIGKLEPSYVIRKFLDAQRIYNLTSYLQELHSRSLANADHTTLLLNCYTKLKDVARLDQFIKTDTELTFDLETAIKVCRQAGYYDHAVYLAEKFEEHDLYLNIMIENVENYENAVHYLRQLGPVEAKGNLQKYGKTLIAHLPTQTTQLLIDLCTGSLALATGRVGSSQTSASGLQPLSTMRPYTSPSTQIAPASPQMSSRPVVGTSRQTIQQAQTQKQSTSGKDKGGSKDHVAYAPPSPRMFMSLFVDRPDCLITFLEQVFDRRWGSGALAATTSSSASIKGGTDATSTKSGSVRPTSESSKARSEDGVPELGDDDLEERKSIWNTLLELYLLDEKPLNLFSSGSPPSPVLSTATSTGAASDRELIKRRKEFKAKALSLLKDPSVPYDTNQALVLCHLKQFDEGIVYLYGRMEMYRDIVRFWMEKDETDRVIEAVRKYGPQDPDLYPFVLTYFSSTPETLAKSNEELLQVLNHIDSADLLPPLQVIQALSRNSVATIGLLKKYMEKKINSEWREVEEDRKFIQSYREETEKKRREIEELKTSARVFQVTKCSQCGGSLNLPTVHFLCRHSYHQRCLPESDLECPRCAIEHRTINEIRRTQEANADRHDLFFAQIEDAEDGFAVVADYFSKNTMAFAKLID